MVWSTQRSGFAENPAFAKICGRSTSWIHTWFNEPMFELEEYVYLQRVGGHISLRKLRLAVTTMPGAVYRLPIHQK
jgi:hypothetical protein